MYENWKGTVDNYGLGTRNERGLCLLEFTRLNNLTIANTLYPHKTSRRYTSTSPDDLAHNQIDFILVPLRFILGVVSNRIRAFPAADIGSDHNFVMMRMKIKLRRIQKKSSVQIKYNLDKLKDPEKKREV